MPVSNVLFNVTDGPTGTVYAMAANTIISLAASASYSGGTDITQVDNKSLVLVKTVQESPATVDAAAGNIFTTTDLSGNTLYMNGDRVVDLITNGSGAIIVYNKQGADNIQVLSSDSIATLSTAINAIAPTGEFVTLATTQTIPGAKTFSKPITYDGVTGVAATGTTQGTATAITHEVSNVTTVTSTNNGVIMPVPVLGMVRKIKNSGGTAYSLLVYPSGTTTMNGGAASAPISLAPGAEVELFAISATDWESMSAKKVHSMQLILTNAQILALNGTALPIVRATGIATEVIMPLKATMAYTRAVASYATNTEIDLIHSGSSNALLKSDIGGAASTFATFVEAESATPSGNTFIANADLNVFVPTGNPTGGNAGSSMKITVVYTIMSAI